MKIKKLALVIYWHPLFRSLVAAFAVIFASNLFVESISNPRFASIIASAMLAGG